MLLQREGRVWGGNRWLSDTQDRVREQAREGPPGRPAGGARLSQVCTTEYCDLPSAGWTRGSAAARAHQKRETFRVLGQEEMLGGRACPAEPSEKMWDAPRASQFRQQKMKPLLFMEPSSVIAWQPRWSPGRHRSPLSFNLPEVVSHQGHAPLSLWHRNHASSWIRQRGGLGHLTPGFLPLLKVGVREREPVGKGP